MSSARRREAEHILKMCIGDHLRAFEVVDRQLAALGTRALVMVLLSGLVALAAGLSGRTEMSHLARVFLLASLAANLAAALTVIFLVLRMRWLSQEIDDEPVVTLLRGLVLRDRAGRGLNAALAFLLAGFSLYCASMLGA